MERLAETVLLSWGARRALTAFFAGALAVLALPPFNFFAIQFISLPLLVWLLDGASGPAEAGAAGRLCPAFATGWWYGFGYFTAGLWWLGNALLAESGEFAWAMPLAIFGLPAFLALFYGFATSFARLVWSDGFGRIAMLAAGFGIAEYGRGILFSGFPWNAVGYTAMPVPLMMQSSSVIGLHGMNVLAVLVFAAPALLGTRKGAVPGLSLALALLAGHIGYGWMVLAMHKPEYPAEGARVFRIVQPAVGQSEKWDAAERERIFSNLLELTGLPPSPGESRPTHIVWPETAIPFLLTENPDALARIADVLQVGQTLITGAVRMEQGQGAEATRYFNSIYLIDDEGQIIGAADKAHLVPFGEYLPFEEALGRLGLGPVAHAFGGFTAADRRAMLNMPGGMSAVPLICYEAIFPELAAIDDSSGDLLLNVTNDAWYGRTPGPYQHLQQARLRAVETRTPLVRAANNGVSAVVDAQGRFLGTLALGDRGILDVQLPIELKQGASRDWQEIFFWLIVAATVFLGIISRTTKLYRAD